jgi:transposase
MVGLTISGKIYKRHFDGSINAEKLLVGLEHLLRHIKGPFILIWDQSRPHKAKIVKAFLEKHPEIHIEYLPAYAPELNPEEYCHGNVKRRMKNAIFLSKIEIRKSIANLWIKVSPDYVSDQTSCSVALIMLVSNLTNFGKCQ